MPLTRRIRSCSLVMLLLFGVALVAGAPRAAEAVTITLVSFGASNVSVGSTVSVQLSISGLGSGAAPALGSWDRRSSA